MQSKKLCLDSFKKQAISNLNLDSKAGGDEQNTTEWCLAKALETVTAGGAGDNDCH